MAGYSGTPLPQKLGIKEGHRVGLVHAPDYFEEILRPLPDDVDIMAGATGKPFDVMICFVRRAAELKRQFSALSKKMNPACGLWIAWPKKASGVATDLSENDIRAVGLAAGLVDNKVCAVNETWSGLRFVIRVKDRPKATRK
jgi:hypothetical protein